MKVESEFSEFGFLEHYFSKGIYLRVLNMKANTVIVGHHHKEVHLSILLSGRIHLSHGEENRIVYPGEVFESSGRKALKVIEDARIVNIIPTDKDTAEDVTAEHIDMNIPINKQDLKFIGELK